MTISSTSRKAGPYVGNGIATVFPFSFKVFSAADLYVVHTSTAIGADTVLTPGSGYTAALNADQNTNPGGTVTLPSALASGYSLTITSSLAYLQPTDLTNQGGFYPRVITNALDRLTIFCQQLYEQIGRALKVSVSTPAGVTTTLPPPVAGNVLGWDAGATGLANYAVGGTPGVAASDLASQDAGRGAALVGWSALASYPRGTVGRAAADAARSFTRLLTTDTPTAAQTTQALQAAIDEGAAAGWVYIPPGVWSVQPQAHAGLAGTFGANSVCIKPRSGLRLYGPGVLTLAAGAGGASGAVIGNWDGAPISDVTIECRIDANAAHAAVGSTMSGVVLANATDCRVANGYVRNASFCGVQFAVASSGCACTGMRVEGIGYIGVQAQRASGLQIVGNVVRSTVDNAIDCEADAGAQEQIVIGHNIINGCATGVFLESGGNAVVIGNDIQAFAQAGVWMNRISTSSENNIITANKFKKGAGAALKAGIYGSNVVGASEIFGNYFQDLNYSMWFEGACNYLDIGENMHRSIGTRLVHIPQSANALVKSRIGLQKHVGPLVGRTPYTTNPLTNAQNFSTRAFSVAVVSGHWDLDAGGPRAAAPDFEYRTGVSGTLIANPAWSGAFSVYSGGETLIYETGTALTVGRYVVIGGSTYYVYSNPGSGIFGIRLAVSGGAPAAGNYTASTNAATAYVEHWPEWQTT